MFSLQTIFGKGDKFYGLLEASAAAARESTQALVELLKTHAGPAVAGKIQAGPPTREDTCPRRSARNWSTPSSPRSSARTSKRCRSALYKIPKIVEKFAERYTLAAERLGDVDFAPRAAMLERACEVIVEMVGLLRKGMNIDTMQGDSTTSCRRSRPRPTG